MKQTQPTYSDAAKRVSDQYNLHKIGSGADAIGQWFAARLSDGTTDGVLYGSKSDAVRGQHHNEDFYAFIQIGPWSMTYQDAETYLATMRKMYDSGLRLADRDASHGGRDVIKRVTHEDQFAQLRSMFRGTPPTNISYKGE